MESFFKSQEMENLLTRVEEAARSTEEGVKRFVEPAAGTLRRSVAKRHHMVFGRRGSGKSSLLRKAAADLTIDRRPIAYVNLETFKSHSYPDVLLSVLISTFSEFEKWLRTAAIHPANKTSFWDKFFGSKPSRLAFNKKGAEELADKIKQQIKDIKEQLHSADDVPTTSNSRHTNKSNESCDIGGVLGGKQVKAEGKISSSDSEAVMEEKKQEFKASKIDFLHRHIIDYQDVFKELNSLSSGDAFLFLDDLYHIRRSDQAQLVDYFHRIAKENNLWLKVGTIRHRTSWYIHGDPPVGVKLGDDADEIDLDLTLEKYSLAKDFLTKILKSFLDTAGSITISKIVNDGAIDRLVLASGGVARDFLAIFRRAVEVAKERGDNHRGGKIGSEDVNVAAGEHERSKREELKRDAPDVQQEIETQFEQILNFCVSTAKANVFLVDKTSTGKWVELLHELVDLRLLHLVRSRVTVSNRSGRIFEAYMLDVSQYTGSRKRHNFEIVNFWKADTGEDLRRVKLIYDQTAV